ncbi:MAG: chemotaxis protein CheD [Chloroflexi bacterium]|nr:chemotaxis protein CheD [Chloroflexota bacterium]
MDTINVNLGEIAVSRKPSDILIAYGLGSCLGIGIYDPDHRVGGLLHAVLPQKLNGNDPFSPKYVDTGILNLIDQMVKSGASTANLIIRMAGGANMLAVAELAKTFDIGSRNINSARKTFEQLNLHLAAEDVGGNIGRTVKLYLSNGRMTVRSIGSPEHDLEISGTGGLLHGKNFDR